MFHSTERQVLQNNKTYPKRSKNQWEIPPPAAFRLKQILKKDLSEENNNVREGFANVSTNYRKDLTEALEAHGATQDVICDTTGKIITRMKVINRKVLQLGSAQQRNVMMLDRSLCDLDEELAKTLLNIQSVVVCLHTLEAELGPEDRLGVRGSLHKQQFPKLHRLMMKQHPAAEPNDEEAELDVSFAMDDTMNRELEDEVRMRIERHGSETEILGHGSDAEMRSNEIQTTKGNFADVSQSILDTLKGELGLSEYNESHPEATRDIAEHTTHSKGSLIPPETVVYAETDSITNPETVPLEENANDSTAVELVSVLNIPSLVAPPEDAPAVLEGISDAFLTGLYPTKPHATDKELEKGEEMNVFTPPNILPSSDLETDADACSIRTLNKLDAFTMIFSASPPVSSVASTDLEPGTTTTATSTKNISIAFEGLSKTVDTTLEAETKRSEEPAQSETERKIVTRASEHSVRTKPALQKECTLAVEPPSPYLSPDETTPKLAPIDTDVPMASIDLIPAFDLEGSLNLYRMYQEKQKHDVLTSSVFKNPVAMVNSKAGHSTKGDATFAFNDTISEISQSSDDAPEYGALDHSSDYLLKASPTVVSTPVMASNNQASGSSWLNARLMGSLQPAREGTVIPSRIIVKDLFSRYNAALEIVDHQSTRPTTSHDTPNSADLASDHGGSTGPLFSKNFSVKRKASVASAISTTTIDGGILCSADSSIAESFASISRVLSDFSHGLDTSSLIANLSSLGSAPGVAGRGHDERSSSPGVRDFPAPDTLSVVKHRQKVRQHSNVTTASARSFGSASSRASLAGSDFAESLRLVLGLRASGALPNVANLEKVLKP
ncbi:hypothetical protein BABINDRAFT_162752 [Babjeviella inositovora NRRL Y-12698]|uniref:Uncharacterized protein n=1 Tax=Babjeviella inositovora NRRL Y-12698 TaxID=984486 RepID=A0A1E3QNI2_9ASCO|nr:uncharacterized protein BABINDRAFT_162752 [Babjeviella inositovora NRRL Y-12698]ODQ78547.1 hypothetical protein BABINDRAFT_162752 [Babjeviella inositovora NRRL Y-12698]